ncbi:hypothetical protein SADUNF_Sadunf11G0019900 [Salix dunnii]|uniref:F-box associated beta-propeller type 1 domain-containing protein n=1 Tax=Salix dunnii TaxID=1413687 RepID=A0A835JMP2_9ROSI|nr:hypothetical protein SADUNF_Sadunf11G0019900 [Salix dunnii]
MRVWPLTRVCVAVKVSKDEANSEVKRERIVKNNKGVMERWHLDLGFSGLFILKTSGEGCVEEAYNVMYSQKLAKSECRIHYRSEVRATNRLNGRGYNLPIKESPIGLGNERIPSPMQREICIFGDNEWKSIGEIPFPACKKFFGVSLNGALHWILNLDDYEDADLICSLDINSKKIRPMSPPNGFRRDTTEMTLGVLRDCLFICDSMTLYNLDIWSTKRLGVKDSWTKEIVIAKTSLPWNLQKSFLQPVMFSKDGESFDDAISCASITASVSIEALTEVKVGSLGNGMLVVELSSMSTTDAMFGL